jgi:hypothetical protein
MTTGKRKRLRILLIEKVFRTAAFIVCMDYRRSIDPVESNVKNDENGWMY